MSRTVACLLTGWIWRVSKRKVCFDSPPKIIISLLFIMMPQVGCERTKTELMTSRRTHFWRAIPAPYELLFLSPEYSYCPPVSRDAIVKWFPDCISRLAPGIKYTYRSFMTMALVFIAVHGRAAILNQVFV